MKRVASLSLAVLLLMVAALEARSVAVVELFTSEGCSSCPAADTLLSRLADDRTPLDRKVYPLAFHVDYWDYIGWTDRFADPNFTQRQRDYAQRMQLRSMYTPQMIVNGTAQFVGSSAYEARNAISQALQTEVQVIVDLQKLGFDKDQLRVGYRLSLADKGWDMVVVLVEAHAQSHVTRGENSGKHLLHRNVVRFMQVVSLKTKSLQGEVALTIPKDISSDYAVVAYVQDRLSGRIVGANHLGDFEDTP